MDDDHENGLGHGSGDDTEADDPTDGEDHGNADDTGDTDDPEGRAEYFEDVAVGDAREFGSYEVTAEEIVEFAERYDPQPFHLDEEAAADSIFGGLVASGWHTAAICMRLLVDHQLDEATSMGARGVDELRWHRPVRPGDVLSVRTEVVEKWPSGTNSEVGHVRSRLEGSNQDGDRVISWVALGMVRRREPGAES